MDVALAFADGLLLDGVYQRVSTVAGWETLARDHLLRQTVSVFAMIFIGGFALYLTLASVNFRWWFDARKEFPSDTECFKQIRKELAMSARAWPMLAAFTTPILVAQIRGYSQLYTDPPKTANELLYHPVSIAAYLLLVDAILYWIHRALHTRWLYKHVHKAHHGLVKTTPFASHAFHWADGFIQSMPYHFVTFVLPIHTYIYASLFLIANARVCIIGVCGVTMVRILLYTLGSVVRNVCVEVESVTNAWMD